jgi:hypothetical protein
VQLEKIPCKNVVVLFVPYIKKLKVLSIFESADAAQGSLFFNTNKQLKLVDSKNHLISTGGTVAF